MIVSVTVEYGILESIVGSGKDLDIDSFLPTIIYENYKVEIQNSTRIYESFKVDTRIGKRLRIFFFFCKL